MVPKKKRIKNKELLRKVKSEPCRICGQPSDPAHVRSRGSGGDDVDWNLVSLCRLHHQEHGQIGWTKFFGRYPRFEIEMMNKGWRLENVFGITKLVRYK